MSETVMAEDGDTLCKLAIAAGFPNCEPLRNEAANSDYLNRPLRAGDEVTIPDIEEEGHPLQGRSVTGRVLVFPRGKGSTVGSYTLYRMKKAGTAPIAILNRECETIVAVGAIIAEIPCVDRIEIEKIPDEAALYVDGDAGKVGF